MTLRELIQQNNLTGSYEEIAAALNAKTQPVYNSELYTSTLLKPRFVAIALGADVQVSQSGATLLPIQRTFKLLQYSDEDTLTIEAEGDDDPHSTRAVHCGCQRDHVHF